MLATDLPQVPQQGGIVGAMLAGAIDG